MVVRNFFAVYVLPDRTPRGGKSQNTGISGRFGPGRPLALRDKPQGWAANGKCNFPVLGAILGGEIRTPQKFLPESAQPFYILRFGRPDPHG